MSTGQWQPQASQPISQSVLHELIHLAQTAIDTLSEQASEAVIHQYPYLIGQDRTSWQQATAELSLDQIIALIQFFTCAETLFPSWHCGPRSPVIHLVAILKQRNAFPGRSLTQWIRAHSTNRYLPYGAIEL